MKTTMKNYYVVSSPRGFSNEFAVAVFPTYKEAKDYTLELEAKGKLVFGAKNVRRNWVVNQYLQDTAKYYPYTSPRTRYQQEGEWRVIF